MKITSVLLIFLSLMVVGCTKDPLTHKENTTAALSSAALKSSSGLESDFSSQYFSEKGGKWEVYWIRQGQNGSFEEFFLPRDEVREEWYYGPCNNETGYIIRTYADTWKSLQLTFSRNGEFKSRFHEIDRDPVPELSNCQQIHLSIIPSTLVLYGNWTFDPISKTMTWLQERPFTSDLDYNVIYSEIVGKVSNVSEKEFTLTGTITGYLDPSGPRTTVEFEYRIRKFSENGPTN